MADIKIGILCCHYTNTSDEEDFKGLPADVIMKRFPCSGHIEVADILKTFEEGAEAVLVAGCEKDSCHNISGSVRAEKRVLGARKILEEIGLSGERVRMAFVPRLDSGTFMTEVKSLFEIALNLKSKSKGDGQK
ncbi:hydrogenase iron-sulfur subunit [Thermosulfurimonas dismutans]|uniref:Methyl-viologen-reducing hydrogenase, delta subunit n=1 Tax=Thermosulfurimonas dismutans TaxID=999894 RepID=A0A179D494_9BACT|nr:hydrogenase iron-sulfur subunit [Thermosulfurimonas dismutans]OAQ20877.1 Methyl-viologen-reducing hydrogenase, delta subunit [Thermosulfurimonas dismutans]